MSCDMCIDENGEDCFPVYGLAPHSHGEGFLSTQISNSNEWPENFTPDPDEPGMGTWSCPYCGSGKPR